MDLGSGEALRGDWASNRLAGARERWIRIGHRCIHPRPADYGSKDASSVAAASPNARIRASLASSAGISVSTCRSWSVTS
jgi:hypothetical protein